MLAVAVQVDERALGVVEAIEPLDLQLKPRTLLGSPACARCLERHPDRAGALPALAGRLLGEIAEVGEQAAPVLGRDRLGMELHPPQRPPAVGHRHQHPVARPGDRLELVRKRLRDAERVVAHRLELARDPGEERRVLVDDGAQAAVHHLRRVHDLRTGGPAEALVAEADAEQRHVGPQDGVRADAEVLLVVGAPRARRDDDVVDLPARQVLPDRAVVAHDDRLLPVRLRKQLKEVVGERVVVVEEERLHRFSVTLKRGTCAAPFRAGSSGSPRGARRSEGP